MQPSSWPPNDRIRFRRNRIGKNWEKCVDAVKSAAPILSFKRRSQMKLERSVHGKRLQHLRPSQILFTGVLASKHTLSSVERKITLNIFRICVEWGCLIQILFHLICHCWRHDFYCSVELCSHITVHNSWADNEFIQMNVRRFVEIETHARNVNCSIMYNINTGLCFMHINAASADSLKQLANDINWFACAIRCPYSIHMNCCR